MRLDTSSIATDCSSEIEAVVLTASLISEISSTILFRSGSDSFASVVASLIIFVVLVIDS